jgi:hypothetical protein
MSRNPVDDSMNEVIRKSAEEIRSDRRAYKLRTSIYPDETTKFQAKKTTIGTTATKIDFPDEGNEFTIYHVDAGSIVWIGGENSISPNTGDVAALPPSFLFPVYVKSGGDIEIYGVVQSGNVDVYVVGMIVES